MPGDRQDMRQMLHAVAYAQSGYFTAAQAVEVGYTYQAQKYHVDHGNWVRVDRGLFRLPGWPPDPEDTYVRWTIWSRGRGVVSHDTALALHGLSDINPARIHLTVPRGFRARDEVVVTHIGEVEGADRLQRRGFALTSVERTLLDVAGDALGQDLLDTAVGQALSTGATSPRLLRRRAADACDRAALGIERALSATGGDR